MCWIILFLTLSVRGLTLNVSIQYDIYRPQILTSKVVPLTERIKELIIIMDHSAGSTESLNVFLCVPDEKISCSVNMIYHVQYIIMIIMIIVYIVCHIELYYEDP